MDCQGLRVEKEERREKEPAAGIVLEDRIMQGLKS